MLPNMLLLSFDKKFVKVEVNFVSRERESAIIAEVLYHLRLHSFALRDHFDQKMQ